MSALTRLRFPFAVIGAFVFAALLAFVAFSSAAEANHSWKSYGKVLHWARTSNPFTLKLGDNVSSAWDSYLRIASGPNTDTSIRDWSDSDELDTQVVAGTTTGAKCDPEEGRVEVCNANYGDNDWLGLAQVWIPNWRSGHISQGISKVNDYYFSQDRYNTTAWRQLVMCQEIAHTFGLDHQDENFNNANLGSCMDYTNDPDGGAGGASLTDPSNVYPNQHDYDQLGTIYGHNDSTNTIRASAASKAASRIPSEINRGDLNSRAQWGQLVRTSEDERLQVFERNVNGSTLITFVKRP